MIPVSEKVSEFLKAKSGQGKASSRVLVEISDKLLLIGDFIKFCAGLSEITTQNQVNPLYPIFTELWPFIDNVLTEFIY